MWIRSAKQLLAPAEGMRMGRGSAVGIVAALLLLSLGGAGVVIWQAKAQAIPLFYILGPLMIVVGIVFTVLHLSVSDEYLRQHFGGEVNANQIRQMWRGGWGGVGIGAAMIAVEYFLGSGI